jgi:hypothetical protein
VGREEGCGQGRRSRVADALNAYLRKAGWLALLATKVATIGFTLEAVVWPNQPKYKGKAMRIRSIGYLGVLALVPIAWLRGNRARGYPIEADLAVSVPVFIDAVGNSLGIYDEARLDDVVHFLNAAALSGLFGAVVSSRVASPAAAAGATVAFGLLGELCFDAMEYAAERIGYTGLGLSREDTLADTALAALGTSVAAAVTWMRWTPPRRPGSRGSAARGE